MENIKQSILSDSSYARGLFKNDMKKASKFGFSVVFWLGGLSSSTLMLLENCSILLSVRLIFVFSSSVKWSATPAKTVSYRDPSFFGFFARFIVDIILALMVFLVGTKKCNKFLVELIKKSCVVLTICLQIPRNAQNSKAHMLKLVLEIFLIFNFFECAEKNQFNNHLLVEKVFHMVCWYSRLWMITIQYRRTYLWL